MVHTKRVQEKDGDKLEQSKGITGGVSGGPATR